MNRIVSRAVAVAGLASLLTGWSISASARTEETRASLVGATATTVEAKEKPPMYSYQTILTLPRAQWGEIEKIYAANRKIYDQAVAEGRLIAYGNDSNLFHTADGWTHVDWWAAHSLAGVFKVRDDINSSDAAASPVLAAATKQVDGAYVSRYYNWRPGSYQGLFTHVGIYKLKADAPGNAVDRLSKDAIMPLLDPLLAKGDIVQYEIDEEAFQTGPGSFFISFMAKTPEDMLKTNAALATGLQSHALGSLVDFTAYRDAYSRTDNVVYK